MSSCFIIDVGPGEGYMTGDRIGVAVCVGVAAGLGDRLVLLWWADESASDSGGEGNEVIGAVEMGSLGSCLSIAI
jgi:hypothetical protein